MNKVMGGIALMVLTVLSACGLIALVSPTFPLKSLGVPKPQYIKW